MLLFLLWSCGPASFALSHRLWKNALPDAGLAVGRVLVLAVWALLTLWLGSWGVPVRCCALLIFPFLFVGFCALWMQRTELREIICERRHALLLSEAFFFGAFAFFLVIRCFAPSAVDGEKPMDLALISTLARAAYLPPANPFAAGLRLDSYYYLGQLQAALLTDASFATPRWTYNLICAALPALTFSSLFSLCAALCRRLRTGSIAALIVLGCGTLEPLRWWWPAVFGTPLNVSAYYATTRVIPFTINEYPFFSFAFGDLHAHVFALPLLVLVMSLAWALWHDGVSTRLAVLSGVALAALFATNSWNLPLGELLIALALLSRRTTRTNIFAVALVFSLTALFSWPFWSRLHSGVVGLQFVDALSFEPLSWLMVWGLMAVAWGVVFFFNFKRAVKSLEYSFLCRLALCGILALIWSEVFWSGFLAVPYERQDTVFKFGLQAWMLLGTAAVCGTLGVDTWPGRRAWRLGYVPLAIAFYSSVLVVMGRTHHFRKLQGVDAWQYLAAPERQAAQWLDEKARDGDAIYEAEKRDGGDYTSFSRYAHATGISAVIGPQAHSYQWIGDWQQVFERKDATHALYAFDDVVLRSAILRKYPVRWVVIGELERREYGVVACERLERALSLAVKFGASNDPHRVAICHNPQR